jgi:hypothetical protein
MSEISLNTLTVTVDQFVELLRQLNVELEDYRSSNITADTHSAARVANLLKMMAIDLNNWYLETAECLAAARLIKETAGMELQQQEAKLEKDFTEKVSYQQHKCKYSLTI